MDCYSCYGLLWIAMDCSGKHGKPKTFVKVTLQTLHTPRPQPPDDEWLESSEVEGATRSAQSDLFVCTGFCQLDYFLS